MSNTFPTRAEVRADAKNRATRTFLQGLAVSVLFAVATVVTGIVSVWTGDDVLSAVAWGTLGASVIQAALTAAASYVARTVIPPAPSVADVPPVSIPQSQTEREAFADEQARLGREETQ